MKQLLTLLPLTTLLACGQQRDTEMWFGRVVAEKHTDVACTHEYCADEVCSCTSEDDDGNCTSESCSCVRYDTHHDRDRWWGYAYDWNLDGSADDLYFDGDGLDDGEESWGKSLAGQWVTLEDCGDCWLSKGKQRVWDATEIGDPVAVPHAFDNYLLVDEESLHLNTTAYAPVVSVPPYPQPHSFHRYNSAVNAGTKMDAQTWNAFLAEKNTLLGNKKQVHMMVVATSDQNPLWADALEEKWKLGKKNNAIFVFGVDKEGIIQWSRLVSFSSVEMMRIRVRDDFKGMHVNDASTAEQVVSLTTEHFNRDPMADKEYLMRNTWWYRWRWFILTPLMGLIGLLGFGLATGTIGGGAYAATRRRRRY